MHQALERITTFFIDAIPSWPAIALGGPAGLVWAWLCLYWAGRLKRDRGWKTGYTRKVFHFLIFTTVAGLQAIWGLSAVCLFGAATSVVIFYGLWRGAGHVLFEAMAREKDEPHRTWYIVAPYMATLIGGVASNILFGPAALVGYLVTGFGDAIGEPVGTRFGKHHYRVPALRGVTCTRSLEGSAAVFVACLIAIIVSVALSATMHFSPRLLFVIPLLALVCAVVEAVSPHGWDNATMQVVPSWLGVWLL